MNPIKPAAGDSHAVERLAVAVPEARLLSRPPFPVPDRWRPDRDSVDAILTVAGRADFAVARESLARVGRTGDRRSDGRPAPSPVERIWVIAPNPASTRDVLALLTGQPAEVDGHFVADLDALLAEADWVLDPGRTRPSSMTGPRRVRGGLGTFLDEFAETSGLGGSDLYLVRCFVPTDPPGNDASATVPFLSVLVRTQGIGIRQRTLRDTLTCLIAQTDLDFELLVLAHRLSADDRDTLGRTLSEFEPLLPGGLRLVEVAEPGRAAPLHAGARVARGDYLAVLDDDDTVLAQWVEAFHDLARTAEHPAVLRCRSVSQRMVVVDPQPGGMVGYRAGEPWDARWSGSFDLLDQLVDNHMPIHSYALPRQALAGSGLTWDPRLPVLEDWDLLMRAVNAWGVVDGREFTSIYRFWPTALNSQGVTGPGEWASTRDELLDDWDTRVWLAPSGTVRHAVRAQFALLDQRPLVDRVRNRVQGLARTAGPMLTGTRLGVWARRAYRRSGLRPTPPE